MRIATVLALAVVGFPLAGMAPADAHASMVASTPEQGAVLDSLPDAVSFEFSQSMDPVAYVVVTAPDGSSVAVGDPEVSGDTVTQNVQDGGEGTYLMAVKAVTEDGHSVTGHVEFAVGEPSDPPVTEASSSTEQATSEEAVRPTRSAAEGRPHSAWDLRGHRPWVWAVGAVFMLVGAGLWMAARRFGPASPS